MNKIYYFAYGSNMNHKQIKERCKNAKFISRVYLEDYDFVYDGYSHLRRGAVANIIPKQGSRVWGGLFEIDESGLKELDKCEGYPRCYQRKQIIVKDDNNKEYQAYVYFREPLEKGIPSEEYRNIVIRGAKDCNLPENYIKEKL